MLVTKAIFFLNRVTRSTNTSCAALKTPSEHILPPHLVDQPVEIITLVFELLDEINDAIF